tara:strand:- start:318 stop:479 length:162 start_codon:yes stop_codon:yes gene_type:complete
VQHDTLYNRGVGMDYKAVKEYWLKFAKDWQEDVKTLNQQVIDFWKDFFNQNQK